MIQQWLNWRTALVITALCIVSGTVFYSHYLSQKLAIEERKKVEHWIEAQKTLLNNADTLNITLASRISTDNTDIPIIETDEKDRITGNYINLDSTRIKSDSNYLQHLVSQFKGQNKPIEFVLSKSPYVANKYYYGESKLQQEIKYYPYVQLLIVALFIIILVSAQRSTHQNTQNSLWAGMAKETAHQLGTPVSSLEGWLEVLKEIPGNENIVSEIGKDINRLQLVTDRFSKIGSTPKLEAKNIVYQVQYMMDYIKKRAGGHVSFSLNTNGEKEITTLISAPLFDWVIENLLKNALDAMEGRGNIAINIQRINKAIQIDVSDTGKGISKANLHKVFKPGFTTKKRGWGLGLTLTQRIIEQYHKGKIFILFSEPGKGTTFRIFLPA